MPLIKVSLIYNENSESAGKSFCFQSETWIRTEVPSRHYFFCLNLQKTESIQPETCRRQHGRAIRESTPWLTGEEEEEGCRSVVGGGPDSESGPQHPADWVYGSEEGRGSDKTRTADSHWRTDLSSLTKLNSKHFKNICALFFTRSQLSWNSSKSEKPNRTLTQTPVYRSTDPYLGAVWTDPPVGCNWRQPVPRTRGQD